MKQGQDTLRPADSETAPVSRMLPRAICERIICLHPPDVDPEWWHALEQADELLLAGGERIVIESLGHAEESVLQAVNAGYRPVLFVPLELLWPEAFRALGRYQAFGEVLARGRDDTAMSYLLHRPSLEIQSAYDGGGRVHVPNPAYGQALDNYYVISLEDFSLKHVDQSEPLAPVVRLASRLNEYRQIEVEIHCKNGVAKFSQYYWNDSERECMKNKCNIPVNFGQWRLDFTRKNDLYSDEEFGENHLAFMKAFTECFDLPSAYRGWEPGEDVPWIGLLSLLTEMGRGIMQYLSPAQQALLDLLDPSQFAKEFQPAGRGALRTMPRKRVKEKSDGLEPAEPPILIRRAKTSENEQAEAVGMTFEVCWLTDKPDDRPTVIAMAPGMKHDDLEPLWNQDLSQLRITGLTPGEYHIGWIWHAENQTLEISFSHGRP